MLKIVRWLLLAKMSYKKTETQHGKNSILNKSEQKSHNNIILELQKSRNKHFFER